MQKGKSPSSEADDRAPNQKASNLARIRDNQRRSRARRKEYLEELERKFRNCEQVGVEASTQLQIAARRVIEENKRLRQLLHQHNLTDAQINQAILEPSPSTQAGTTFSAVKALESNLGVRYKCDDSSGCRSPNAQSVAVLAHMQPSAPKAIQRLGVNQNQRQSSTRSSSIQSESHIDPASNATDILASPSASAAASGLHIQNGDQVLMMKPSPPYPATVETQTLLPHGYYLHQHELQQPIIYPDSGQLYVQQRDPQQLSLPQSPSSCPSLAHQSPMMSQTNWSPSILTYEAPDSASNSNGGRVSFPCFGGNNGNNDLTSCTAPPPNFEVTEDATSCVVAASAIRSLRPELGIELEQELCRENIGTECRIPNARIFGLMDKYSDMRL